MRPTFDAGCTSDALRHYFDHLGWPRIDHVERVDTARHHVHRVRTVDGRRLVIKRGAVRDENGDGSLLNEGLGYHFLASSTVDVVPRCILHDRGNDLLVLEDVDLPSLTDVLSAASPNMLSTIGSHLARLHRATVTAPAERVFDDMDDLIPRADPVSPAQYAALSDSERRLTAVAQSDPLVAQTLTRLCSGPHDCLVHGDLRTDNVLIDPTETDRPRVVLVDLELVRFGDPLLDVGTLIASMIEERIVAGRPRSRDTSSAEVLRSAVRSRRDHVRALLGGYLAAADVSTPPWTAPVGPAWRLGGFVGAHLLHRAAAYGRDSDGLTGSARTLAVAACHVLRRPRTVLADIGVRPSVTPAAAVAEAP